MCCLFGEGSREQHPQELQIQLCCSNLVGWSKCSLQRGKAAAVQSRGVRAGEGPLGGSILTALTVDVGISASVLQEHLCVPGPSLCVRHWLQESWCLANTASRRQPYPSHSKELLSQGYPGSTASRLNAVTWPELGAGASHISQLLLLWKGLSAPAPRIA